MALSQKALIVQTRTWSMITILSSSSAMTFPKDVVPNSMTAPNSVLITSVLQSQPMEVLSKISVFQLLLKIQLKLIMESTTLFPNPCNIATQVRTAHKVLETVALSYIWETILKLKHRKCVLLLQIIKSWQLLMANSSWLNVCMILNALIAPNVEMSQQIVVPQLSSTLVVQS